MSHAIALTVLTHEGVALEAQASSVIAPGEVGYLGLLRNHAPLVTTLVPGTLRWRREARGEWHEATVGRGLLEVVHNQVTILTDVVSRADG